LARRWIPHRTLICSCNLQRLNFKHFLQMGRALEHEAAASASEERYRIRRFRRHKSEMNR
jgi:hypothetical protein